MDEDDLTTLDADLAEFHEVKNIFIQKRAQTSKYGFNNIAKLHFLRHYTHVTREMGTPDGYTTETPERLHKDYIKVSYLGSNGVVPEPQMITNLRRREAWQMLRAKYERENLVAKRQRHGRLEEEPIDDEGLDADERIDVDDGDDEWVDVDIDEAGDDLDEEDGEAELEAIEAVAVDRADEHGTRVKEMGIYQFDAGSQISKRPLHIKFDGGIVTRRNIAHGFMGTITNYVRRLDPNLAFHLTDSTKFHVWSRFSLHHNPLPFAPLAGRKIDVIRASPALYLRGHITRPAVFDMVLLEAYPNMVGLLCEY